MTRGGLPRAERRRAAASSACVTRDRQARHAAGQRAPRRGQLARGDGRGEARRGAAAAARARPLGAAGAGSRAATAPRFAGRSTCSPRSGRRSRTSSRSPARRRPRWPGSIASIARILKRSAAISPPEELTAAHAVFVSAVHMAENAALIRREATLAEQRRARVGRLVCGRRRADARRHAREPTSGRCSGGRSCLDYASPDAAGARPRPSGVPPGHRLLFDRGRPRLEPVPRPSSCRRAAPPIILLARTRVRLQPDELPDIVTRDELYLLFNARLRRAARHPDRQRARGHPAHGGRARGGARARRRRFSCVRASSPR